MEKIYLAVRVGISDNLENILFRYSKKFRRWPEGDSTVKKFFIVEGEENNQVYIVVSDTEGGVISSTDYYNITVTVHGGNVQKVVEKMGDLEKNLGIALRQAPQTLILKYKLLAGMKEEMVV